MSNRARRRPLRLASAALLATCLLGTSLAPVQPADAYVIPTQEVGIALPSHLMTQINTLTQRLQDYQQYAQDAMRWQATWQHYYQQISRFFSHVRNPTLNDKIPFEKVAPDFGVAERCGGKTGFSFDPKALATMLMPDMEGDVVQSQKKVCAQIQMLQNQKHNAVVDYVQGVAPSLLQDLQNITAQRASNNEQGTVAAVNEASARLEATETQKRAELEDQIRSCDSMIASLKEVQKTLAVRALRGRQDALIGTIIQAGTLEAALNYHRK